MSFPDPNDQEDFLETVALALHQLQVDYFVTGSQASAMYGEPRFTQDIDIVVALTPEDIKQLSEAFDAPESYLSELAARDAVQRRGMFDLIDTSTGNKVDFIVAKDDDFERSRMERRRVIAVSADLKVTFSSPEDIVIAKMRWHMKDKSDRHVRDIVGVLLV